MDQLSNLKNFTTVVADTGDIEEIKKYSPKDATTNPSLIFKASQNPMYKHLIEESINFSKDFPKEDQLNICMDKLLINFAKEILKNVPGRVSIEIDARLSFDIKASIEKALSLIDLLEKEKISKRRVLIKLASTWEGIEVCRALEKKGISCNMTLLFSLPQAIAAAQANATLISPFVGRILDWHMKNSKEDFLKKEDPGVLSVKTIFDYFKKFNYKTEVMGASFRSKDQILKLSGCDLLTIAPKFLKELKESQEKVLKRLDEKTSKEMDLKKIDIDEKTFRYLLCKDAMASEKLLEGIRKFCKDVENLENFIKTFL